MTDIAERLEAFASVWPTAYDSDRQNIALLREAAAEIVRLREDNLRQANAMYADGMASELMDIAPAEAKGDGWEENVRYLLDSYPGSIRVRPGAGPEELIGSLSVTFIKLRDLAMKAPQPADGEAVAEWQVWHEHDGWGATHPDNVAEYRARGVPVRPLYAHPPAPVQAAPQEGECAWDYDEDTDAWNGTCGSMWQFTAGDPDDNDMHYCPKCGKRCALQHRGDSRGGEG